MTGAREPLPPPSARPDFAAIARWIRPGAKVLDLGCGDGALLRYLRDARATFGYGVEISYDNIVACVRNGVNVVHADLEAGLSIFRSDSFDYVILSQTLQAMTHTEGIVREMLRVGREGVVTFPNFGFWRHRWQVLFGGMPVSESLPYQWYNTPNVRLCTISDFENFCHGEGVRICERLVLHNGREIVWRPNLRGSLAVYRFDRAGA